MSVVDIRVDVSVPVVAQGGLANREQLAMTAGRPTGKPESFGAIAVSDRGPGALIPEVTGFSEADVPPAASPASMSAARPEFSSTIITRIGLDTRPFPESGTTSPCCNWHQNCFSALFDAANDTTVSHPVRRAAKGDPFVLARVQRTRDGRVSQGTDLGVRSMTDHLRVTRADNAAELGTCRFRRAIRRSEDSHCDDLCEECGQ